MGSLYLIVFHVFFSHVSLHSCFLHLCKHNLIQRGVSQIFQRKPHFLVAQSLRSVRCTRGLQTRCQLSPLICFHLNAQPGTRDAVAWGWDEACRAKRTILPIAAYCLSAHKSRPQTRGKPLLCTASNHHRAIGSSAPKRLPPNKIKQLRIERTAEGVKMAYGGHAGGS